jgi:thymidylate synthase ThyX
MYDLANLPQREWNKTLEKEWEYKGKVLRIFSVEPQAHLIGITKAIDLLDGYPMDAILVKAFEKNYKTPSKPGVVDKYGFEQMHGEPLELVSFVYEMIYDRSTEGQMNRYRVGHSKNYESGRYVDYIKHGLTIVFPDDCVTEDDRRDFIENDVAHDLQRYVDATLKGAKKQAARRRIGEYRAVESIHSFNLRSLWHVSRQRSSELSPNGKEAEPQIGSIASQMVNSLNPHLPRFYGTLIEQIGKGYR